ncbi:MAG: type II toxin-antitoxin system HicA family toxin [Minisyncoccota bacterium]
MSKPKRLSGQEVVKILERFGFKVERQRGSHITLARVQNGQRQVLLISNHKELKTGAVVGIYKQASHYIPEEELRKYFYAS